MNEDGMEDCRGRRIRRIDGMVEDIGKEGKI
jgi:hypothetical protein